MSSRAEQYRAQMDKRMREALTAIQLRRCRYCGCTEENACITPDGQPCSWVTTLCDVCSAPACQRAYFTSLRSHRARRRRKRSAA